MEIKDFIKTSLKEISEALNETSIELNKKVKLTNTVLRTAGQGNYGIIEFDLAVEAKNSQSKGSSGALKISVVEAKLVKILSLLQVIFQG